MASAEAASKAARARLAPEFSVLAAQKELSEALRALCVVETDAWKHDAGSGAAVESAGAPRQGPAGPAGPLLALLKAHDDKHAELTACNRAELLQRRADGRLVDALLEVPQAYRPVVLFGSQWDLLELQDARANGRRVQIL